MHYPKSGLTRGYADRILAINLGTGTVATPDLDQEVRDFSLGGRGLGLYLLHRSILTRLLHMILKNP